MSVWLFFEFKGKTKWYEVYKKWTCFFVLVGLMCQNVNLLWKIVVKNAGCALAYFCDWYINNKEL